MAEPKHQNLSGSRTEQERIHQPGSSKYGEEEKGCSSNLNKLQTPNKKTTEHLLRQLFTKHKGEPKESDELTREMERAFQFFRSDFPVPQRNTDKERNIRERITNLQKRASETLQVLTDCKENISSVVFLGRKPEAEDSDDLTISDTRSLDELTEEIRKIQNREPSSSATAVEQPDIDDMKNATDQLLTDLGRISRSYGGGKTRTTWLSQTTGKQK